MQLTAAAALLAAVIAGTFGLVSAVVSGWSAQRRSRQEALIAFRLNAAQDLLAVTRVRINRFLKAQMLQGTPSHEVLRREWFPSGYDPREVEAFRMSCPFAIHNIAIRVHAAEFELERHLRQPHPAGCKACELLISRIGFLASTLHSMLERFIFFNECQPRWFYLALWRYRERRYNRMWRDNRISRPATVWPDDLTANLTAKGADDGDRSVTARTVGPDISEGAAADGIQRTPPQSNS